LQLDWVRIFANYLTLIGQGISIPNAYFRST